MIVNMKSKKKIQNKKKTKKILAVQNISYYLSLV